jgi:hypothetical protein
MVALEIFENGLEAFIQAFEKKHGVEFDYWLDEIPCGLASFNGSYFFEFEDMYIDLASNIQEGLILDFHDSMLDRLDISEQLLTTYSEWLTETRRHSF